MVMGGNNDVDGDEKRSMPWWELSFKQEERAAPPPGIDIYHSLAGFHRPPAI